MTDFKVPEIPTFDLGHCYHLGYDCGKNGPNTTNCHFAAFASREKTSAWERGKRDAETGRPCQAQGHNEIVERRREDQHND